MQYNRHNLQVEPFKKKKEHTLSFPPFSFYWPEYWCDVECSRTTRWESLGPHRPAAAISILNYLCSNSSGRENLISILFKSLLFWPLSQKPNENSNSYLNKSFQIIYHALTVNHSYGEVKIRTLLSISQLEKLIKTTRQKYSSLYQRMVVA